MAYRQCPKRLWLEIHKPELRDDSGSQMAFAAGNQVGAVARSYFDPKQKGSFIDIHALGHSEAIRYSAELLSKAEGPVFEAGLFAAGALAYADVMLPNRRNGKAHWRMIEVKSSTKVHDHYRDDLAIQAFIASEAGISLTETSIAYIDNSFTYPGNGYYGEIEQGGLFQLLDLTEETSERFEEVREWVALAHEIAQNPMIARSAHTAIVTKQFQIFPSVLYPDSIKNAELKSSSRALMISVMFRTICSTSYNNASKTVA